MFSFFSFFETGRVEWESFGDFSKADVYKQVECNLIQ